MWCPFQVSSKCGDGNILEEKGMFQMAEVKTLVMTVDRRSARSSPFSHLAIITDVNHASLTPIAAR